MKEIELLNKIANGEIRAGFKIKSKNGDIYEYIEGKNHFVNTKDKIYVWSLGDFTKLNNEIEIIEEKKDIEKIEFEQYSKQRFLDYGLYEEFDVIKYKFNEIIDAVNELRSK